ncbi:hypothetical protein KM043_007347 [Ampulex compressa]|nr:hypothetical protein KM043_007347 [Ampulex compressa]
MGTVADCSILMAAIKADSRLVRALGRYAPEVALRPPSVGREGRFLASERAPTRARGPPRGAPKAKSGIASGDFAGAPPRLRWAELEETRKEVQTARKVWPTSRRERIQGLGEVGRLGEFPESSALAR